MAFGEENHNTEYKRLEKAIGKKNLKELARECVCFANAVGGMIYIGLDDKTKEPPVDQKINETEVNKIIKALRGFTNSVGIAEPSLHIHDNGGQYFSPS